MKRSAVTNEDLAHMIKAGFDHVDERFERIENRLDRIERVILADHERRLARLEGALALPK